MNITRSILIIPLTGLLLIGCANHNGYKEPISKFQAASAVVIENARTEYKLVNKKERDAEIDKYVYLGEEINPEVLGSEDLIVIKKEDLDVRIDALNTLARHGELLVTLANSTTPDEARSAVNSLDEALVKLKGSLGQAPSDDFKTKAGVFATLAGEVTKLAMERKIEKALDEAIVLSKNNVLSLIHLLKKDIVYRFSVLHRLRLHSVSKAVIRHYNKELSSSNLEKRKKLAIEVKKIEDALAEAAYPVDPGFERMEQAYKTLIKYAENPKSPQSFAELVEAMDAFANQAKIIADAIKKLNQ